MFNIKNFAQKNSLLIEDETLCQQMQQKLEENALVGFQSRGMIAGMADGSLQAFGMNTAFPNGIYVSCYHETPCSDVTLHLIPQVVSIGLEADDTLDTSELTNAIQNLFSEHNLFLQSAACFATIKEMEHITGIKEACDTLQIDCHSYTADELLSVEGMFSIGEPQNVRFGVDKVCERAAVRSSAQGDLIVRRRQYETFALALAIKNYTVSF
jgi:cobalt-precorrin 5A hydrolase